MLTAHTEDYDGFEGSIKKVLTSCAFRYPCNGTGPLGHLLSACSEISKVCARPLDEADPTSSMQNSPSTSAMSPRMFDGIFDGIFGGMLGGMVDGMPDRMLDEILDGMLDEMAR